MNLILKIVLTTLAVPGISSILSGIGVTDWKAAMLVAVVLGLLNNILRPILIILTIPVTILSLGLFLFVINAGMVMLCDYFIDGFAVSSFWWALGFSLLLSVTQSILYSIFGLKPRKQSSDRRED